MRSDLTLAGAAFASRARVWRYDGSDLHHIHQLASAPVSGGVVRLTYPASSITLLVIPRR